MATLAAPLQKYKTYTLLEGHKGPVNVVRFSPDARYLATGGSDSKITGQMGRGKPGRTVPPHSD
ncbi:hypothetical protein M422DRAFT_270484 [Sphaerobolus stellatus SS14]|uniref:Uncharacterized protein n=1 Tax=Sphaerobolus stellatus (strain SS14) TaxID=990650 RepID=A0A0C9UH00_SPHS4|nr:hypothetical protein M422DRAFT_270484 [Sphaerobolus stellatus SS14]